ncbi:acetolactate decarboxylase [Phaeospirillum tilakii]|uniref:Alpha-acetolactate decarboxylase n=1 Tax=Phaeospirillum tilakii TaxID=741673 RepID=A0ABW5CGF2_9PROT
MRRFLAAVLIVGMTSVTPAGAADLYQVSILDALLHGVYDGEISLGELGRQGDLGLGTINGLDGEMVAVDGKFYRVGTDGRAAPLPPETRTPFAMITPFTPTLSAPVPEGLDLAGLDAWLARTLPPANHVQAVRIDGRFAALKLRSVPRQTPPYPPLTAALAHQAIFEHREMDGTLLGFRFPAYAQGINATGTHFHFLDAERGQGGHVLGLVTGAGARAQIAVIDRLVVTLPGDAAFAAAPLGQERQGGANAVEGQ